MSLSGMMKRIGYDRLSSPGERLFHYARTVRGVTENPPMKPGDSFRCSSLPYLCPREEVLASQNDIIRTFHADPGLQITFDIGTYLHMLYRDVYFGPMGDWAGSWACVKCGWTTDDAGLSHPPRSNNGCIDKGLVTKMPKECGSCGAPFIGGSNEIWHGTFNEWSVEDKGIGLKGHMDGWSVVVVNNRVLEDLKTHGHRGFNSRRTAREGHNLQVYGYGYMTGDSGGEIWYLNKSPWGDHGSFIRDVVLKPDKHVLRTEVLAPLEVLQNGLNGGKIPDRICVRHDCPRAMDCQLKTICFS